MRTAFQDVLTDITHGDHCCLLFGSLREQIETTVPFLGIGLERGERSVFVGDDDEVEGLRDGLRNAGLDVDREAKKGRLVLSSARDYLEDGRFNTDKMLSFLQRAYDSALADGHTALRAAGDVTWEVGPHQDYRDVVYYETLLDVFFLGKKMVGMCQYPKDKCPPEVLEGILGTHRIAAVDSAVCSNFHYVPPDLLLEKNPETRQKKRVEWMTSQLLRARKAEAEILRLNAELEGRVVERTAELQAAFQDMEAFSYSVSHDLRAPLRAIGGFSRALADDCADRLPPDGQRHLEQILQATGRMGRLIDDLLEFSRLSRAEVSRAAVDMTALARSAAEETGALHAEIDALPPARGDAPLLRQVFINLLSNAVKFTRGRGTGRIQVGSRPEGAGTAYFVKDNGAGFDMACAHKLFGVFQRLHPREQFEGTGIGLANVQRIILKHGGRIWAEGRPDEGATFTFTLPAV